METLNEARLFFFNPTNMVQVDLIHEKSEF